MIGTHDSNETEFLYYLVLACALAAVTYLLEIAVVLPIWRSFLRSGKTGLLWFAATGFSLAFAFSFFIIGLLTSFGPLESFVYARAVFLFAIVGAVEAVVFWFFVRPDKVVLEEKEKHINETITP
jgi:hypothetical protein